MNLSRTLLIPIDFSNASKVAVRYALHNEYKKSDKLILLHTYRLIAEDYTTYRDAPRELKKILVKQLTQQFENFSQTLGLDQYQEAIEFITEVGFTVNCIHSICQKRPIDMIVFGIKSDKDNQIAVDLIDRGCPPILLIAESMDEQPVVDYANKTTTPADFAGHAGEYIHELQTHPHMTYLVRA